MLGKTALLTLLDELGIAYSLIEHSAVMTIEESRAVRGSLSGVLCKCLFLRDKNKGFWLAALPGEMRVDLKKLAARLTAKRLSFASEQDLTAILGLRPGAVSLFGAVNDTQGLVRVILAKSLLDAEKPLYFHPMVNTASVGVMPGDVHRFLNSCGHAPMMVDDNDVEEKKAG